MQIRYDGLSNFLVNAVLTLLKNHVNLTTFLYNVPKWDDKRTMELVLNLNLVVDKLNIFCLDRNYLDREFLFCKIVDSLPYLTKAAICYLLKECKLAGRAEAFL